MTTKNFEDRVAKITRLSNTPNGKPRFNVCLAVYGWVVTGQDGQAASKVENFLGHRAAFRIYETPVGCYMIDINAAKERNNGNVRQGNRVQAARR